MKDKRTIDDKIMNETNARRELAPWKKRWHAFLDKVEAAALKAGDKIQSAGHDAIERELSKKENNDI